MSARSPAPRPPLPHTLSPPGRAPRQGTPRKHTGPFTAWESWPPRTPAREPLQSRPGLYWPSTPAGSPSSRATSPPFRCPGAPHHHSKPPPRGLALPLPVSSTPPAQAGELVLLRPRQCWHGGWGSLGVDEGHPPLVFTVRV